MEDSYGDGWNGASIDVNENGSLNSNVFLSNGFTGSQTISITSGSNVTLTFNSGGQFDYEISWFLIDNFGIEVCSGSNPSSGTICTFSNACTNTFESNLPLVIINTNNQEIVDEPSIVADFGIIYNGPSNTNSPLDPLNEYSGKISIEIRGQSSQTFPKKNYKFETIDQFGVDQDAEFLDFPLEEDWILHGPYSDKSLMRNVLAMDIHRKMNRYSSRTQYCEVFINGFYKGVYVLMEKIKRDQERVDISKLSPDEITGDDVTGGYIFKIDKGNDPGWNSQYNIWTDPSKKLRFSYVYPKPELIVNQQKNYIKQYVDSFEYAINSSDYTFNGKRYDAFIDLESFVDNFIINELSKDVDAYRISSYFYKDKTSKGGLINASPVWDFNLAFRNADYCNGAVTSQWIYNMSCDDGNPFWLSKMMNDDVFKGVVHCRWNYYREHHLHKDSISDFIDAQELKLGDAVDRNFQKWDVLGDYIWPNPFPIASTHSEEIANMKTFINDRIDWMDFQISQWNEICDYTTPQPLVNIEENKNLAYFDLYPNPTADVLNLSTQSGHKEVTIFNLIGELVLNFETDLNTNKIDLINLDNGVYILNVKHSNGYNKSKKFTKI